MYIMYNSIYEGKSTRIDHLVGEKVQNFSILGIKGPPAGYLRLPLTVGIVLGRDILTLIPIALTS